MPEFNGIQVTLNDGACRNFLPGPSRPGVTRYTASREPGWLLIHAVCPAEGGYLAETFAAHAVRGYVPLP